MSQTIPEKNEIWVHRTNGRRVTIGEAPAWHAKHRPYPKPMVWYKAVSNPNGSHTALTKTTLERFLKQYRPAIEHILAAAQAVRDDGGEPPVLTADEIGMDGTLHVAPWPQPINTGTLAALSAAIKVRAQALFRYAESNDVDEGACKAMLEIADAIDSLSSGITFDRAVFLSMKLSTLILKTCLADVRDVRQLIAAGDVYLDGQRVTEDAPITTVTRERFTVRCGERSAVVRVIG